MAGTGGAIDRPIDRPIDRQIDRLGAQDRLQLAVDVGPAPMHTGAVVLLGGAPDPEVVLGLLDERVRRVPRMRRRLVRAPLGAGPPMWADDPAFDIRRHVTVLTCPGDGDEGALLSVAADLLERPLPRSRPLWSAALVTGLRADRSALVLVVHHAMADGLGGLAVLGRLLDGGPGAGDPEPPPDPDFPRPLPDYRVMVDEAWRSRRRAAAGLPARLRSVVAGSRELGGGVLRAPRTSLNRPTGPRRGLAVARADLAGLRRTAHAAGATVNDTLLAAVGGSLGALARSRGEDLGWVVVSVPVAARRSAEVTGAGNAVGAMPVPVPTTPEPWTRLRAVAAATRSRKSSRPGSSTSVLVPVFAVLARVGAFRWFIDRQRLVTTFATNLVGPAGVLHLAGAEVVGLVPVTAVPGNVAVTFTAMSYRGELVVTVATDAVGFPDSAVVVEQLQRELDLLVAGPEER